MVAVYYRTNLTMRQLAPLFGVSPATVCRVIQRLGPVLAIEPVRRPADATDRLWIVDGTLIPVRDRQVGASSRNRRFSANVQVIIDAATKLVIATARPAPGNRADARVWRESGLAQYCQDVTVLADGAYINAGLARRNACQKRSTSSGGHLNLLQTPQEDPLMIVLRALWVIAPLDVEVAHSGSKEP